MYQSLLYLIWVWIWGLGWWWKLSSEEMGSEDEQVSFLLWITIWYITRDKRLCRPILTHFGPPARCSEPQFTRSTTQAPFTTCVRPILMPAYPDPSMDTLKVTIDLEQSIILVYNNGRGIPIEIHSQEKIYIPELIFGHLLASSNYDDDEKRLTGGRNGFGAKLTNTYSHEFTIETANKNTQQKYKQTWTNNVGTCGKAKLTKNSKDEEWTRITFRPDLKRFGMRNRTHLSFFSFCFWFPPPRNACTYTYFLGFFDTLFICFLCTHRTCVLAFFILFFARISFPFFACFEGLIEFNFISIYLYI